MAQVIQITEMARRGLAEGIRELLAMAEAGKLTGLAFVGRMGEHEHGVGLYGDYAEDSVPVLAASNRLSHYVNTLLDAREAERKAGKPPGQVIPLKPEPTGRG